MDDKQAIEFFVAVMKDEGKSTNTIKNYLADLRDFEKFWGVHGGTGVVFAPQQGIKKYIQQIEKSGLAKSTVNRRIQTLRTFYTTLQAKGKREDNPTESLKSIRIAKQNETKWLTSQQVQAIFEAIEKPKDNRKHGKSRIVLHRAIISVLVNCGLRVQELCDVKMSDIDWEQGLISIVGKGGKFRKVPFNPATQRNVKMWLQYRNLDTEYLFHTERSLKMTPRAVQHMIQVITKQLNFTFTAHQLRHTALKNIANTTGRIEIVATVAGHDSVNTSKRYIEPSLAEIGEAMKKTEFDY